MPYLERAAAGRDPEPWIEIAQVRLDQGEHAAAIAAARQALARNPGHPWALALEGHALVLSGRKPEGMEALKRALRLQPRRRRGVARAGARLPSPPESAPRARCLEQADQIARG